MRVKTDFNLDERAFHLVAPLIFIELASKLFVDWGTTSREFSPLVLKV